MNKLLQIWEWLKANDIPTNVSTIFTGVLWPVVLFIYTRRRVRTVSGLDVSVAPHAVKVDNVSCPAALVKFTNTSDTVIYLHNPRIFCSRKTFAPHQMAQQHIGDLTCELKFKLGDSKDYTERQFILQTNSEAETVLPLANQFNLSIKGYKAGFFRKLFGVPKYFRLEYTAVVRDRRYRVRFIH
ncbi:MAG: hypothetical protein HY301_02400 [Verrucomicrobia bacterium]|nr:hypothetical protein [Verrucomicrobiota bacterium]